MDDLIDLLKRQYKYLIKQDGVKCVRQVKLFVTFIQDEPRLNSIIADLTQEAEQAVKELEVFDDTLLPKLIEYRKELADKAPEYDDTNIERPSPGSVGGHDYESSFAFFDNYVAGTDKPRGIPLWPNPNDDRTKFKTLMYIVRGKAFDLVNGYDPATRSIVKGKERKDLLPLLEKIRMLEAQHDHRYRKFLDLKYSHAGPAWISLQQMLGELNPLPEDYWSLSTDQKNERLERAVNGVGGTLNKALYENGTLNDEDQQHLEHAADFMKQECERVYQELMLRIGSQRSHLSLIHRYKYRCEWHEQSTLRNVAESSKTPEDDLTRTLALWLFDQGLNPLTKMRAGNLEPDVLEPLSRPNMYVEAKQYKGSSGTRKYLIKGIGQMFDTMARLHGTPYAVHDGYYVVYRLSGPRYVLPERINYGGITIYPVLIDIAGAEESGSRQKFKPVIITEAELVDGTDLSVSNNG